MSRLFNYLQSSLDYNKLYQTYNNGNCYFHAFSSSIIYNPNIMKMLYAKNKIFSQMIDLVDEITSSITDSNEIESIYKQFTYFLYNLLDSISMECCSLVRTGRYIDIIEYPFISKALSYYLCRLFRTFIVGIEYYNDVVNACNGITGYESFDPMNLLTFIEDDTIDDNQQVLYKGMKLRTILYENVNGEIINKMYADLEELLKYHTLDEWLDMIKNIQDNVSKFLSKDIMPESNYQLRVEERQHIYYYDEIKSIFSPDSDEIKRVIFDSFNNLYAFINDKKYLDFNKTFETILTDKLLFSKVYDNVGARISGLIKGYPIFGKNTEIKHTDSIWTMIFNKEYLLRFMNHPYYYKITPFNRNVIYDISKKTDEKLKFPIFYLNPNSLNQICDKLGLICAIIDEDDAAEGCDDDCDIIYKIYSNISLDDSVKAEQVYKKIPIKDIFKGGLAHPESFSYNLSDYTLNSITINGGYHSSTIIINPINKIIYTIDDTYRNSDVRNFNEKNDIVSHIEDIEYRNKFSDLSENNGCLFVYTKSPKESFKTKNTKIISKQIILIIIIVVIVIVVFLIVIMVVFYKKTFWYNRSTNQSK